jgi:RHS repeat-associated protein
LPPVSPHHGDPDAGERGGHPLHPGDARARAAGRHVNPSEHQDTQGYPRCLPFRSPDALPLTSDLVYPKSMVASHLPRVGWLCRDAPAAGLGVTLGENPRLAKKFLGARSSPIWACVSRESRWGWDGAWLRRASGTLDAWNRLVKVMDGATTVATYAYDGRNFRVSKSVSGTARHFYFNSNWQCLEERVGASTYANRQYLWGLRYVDDLLLRDRDADGSSGTGSLGLSGSGLEERLYALQDPNWNVVAISNTGGAIQERYCYDAYGRSTVLTGVFGSRASSSYDWETRYTGRYLDKDTGFQDSRNRWYVGYVGRWLSRDPIGYRGGRSLYGYVMSHPLDLTDPDGLDIVRRCTCCCCCVESLSIPEASIKKERHGQFYGHSFNVVIETKYVWSSRRVDCTLKWLEKTNRPYDNRMKPDTWTDMYILRPRPDFTNWIDRKAVCDRNRDVKLPTIISDSPMADINQPARYLYFAIKVESGKGCRCQYPSLWVFATQILEPWPFGQGRVKRQDFDPTELPPYET